MTLYWLLFAVPIIGVVIPLRLSKKIQTLIWIVFAIFVTLIIGTRYEVGGDWDNYLAHLARASSRDFISAAITNTELGYGALNWISAKLGMGIYGVNTFCGAILVFGTAFFCRRQPIPWLAWLIATPYLLVVVGMGYTRQSVAVGFLLLGLVALENKKVWRYFLLILAGYFFHKTVLLMAPLGILVWRRNRLLSVLIAGAALILIVIALFLPHYLLELWENIVLRYQNYSSYDNTLYRSSGALPRVLMNAMPSFLFLSLLLLKRWPKSSDNQMLWAAIAIASIASLYFVGHISTAIDRINIYFIPIQLYVWSRIPLVISDRMTRTLVIVLIIFVYGISFLVWLNWADNSGNWLPYSSILFL